MGDQGPGAGRWSFADGRLWSALVTLYGLHGALLWDPLKLRGNFSFHVTFGRISRELRVD
jgi:hypothetical protein